MSIKEKVFAAKVVLGTIVGFIFAVACGLWIVQSTQIVLETVPARASSRLAALLLAYLCLTFAFDKTMKIIDAFKTPTDDTGDDEEDFDDEEPLRVVIVGDERKPVTITHEHVVE